MTDYKLYNLDAAGRVTGPPEVLSAESDAEAIRLSRELKNERFELWRETTRVLSSGSRPS